jgi:hypothetical protein
MTRKTGVLLRVINFASEHHRDGAAALATGWLI